MKQKTNKITDAQSLPSAHNHAKPMLSAAAFFDSQKQVSKNIKSELSTETKRAITLLIHVLVIIPFYFWYCTLEEVNILKFFFAFTVGLLANLSCMYIRHKYLS